MAGWLVLSSLTCEVLLLIIVLVSSLIAVGAFVDLRYSFVDFRPRQTIQKYAISILIELS